MPVGDARQTSPHAELVPLALPLFGGAPGRTGALTPAIGEESNVSHPWHGFARELESSLRVSECCQLRVKDLDFDQGLVTGRDGKGGNDRSTLLADVGRDDLRRQLRRSEALHRADRAAGLAGVWLPDALERKYPNAGRELGWFWVFPSQALSIDPRAGVLRRHHLSESVIHREETRRLDPEPLAVASTQSPIPDPRSLIPDP